MLIIIELMKCKLQIRKTEVKRTITPSVNIIGSYNLAFHNQHNIAELKHLFFDIGIRY